MEAVIHNAGVLSGRQLLAVNVLALYLLTARMTRPGRLIGLSSGMRLGGRAALYGLDWSGRKPSASYSDTKLLSQPWPWRLPGCGLKW